MSDKKYLPPIHLACTDNELRPALQHIHILDGIATATDGRLLVQINLQEHSKLKPDDLSFLDNLFIHMDIWSAIMNAEVLEIDSERIVCTKGGAVAEYSLKQPAEISFPEYKGLLKDIRIAATRQTDAFAISPKEMARIGKCLESSSLFFDFYGAEKAAVIYSALSDKRFAIYMPIGQIEVEKQVYDYLNIAS